MSERLNSRSSRSRMISMWSSPRKPASESEAERAGCLGLEGERGVIDSQLLERVAEFGVLIAIDGIEPTEHHRLGLEVAGQGLASAAIVRDGFTRAGLADVLDARDQIPDLARPRRGNRRRHRQTNADLLDVVGGARHG